MEDVAQRDSTGVDDRLALRLAALRHEWGLSLDELAERSGISRTTLSRIERGETSPTAALLGRLCTAYGRTMSRLLAEVETGGALLLRRDDQPVWEDPETGFSRRSVSPPAQGFAAELVECRLPAGASIAYQAPGVTGLEQHLWMLEGVLMLAVENVGHRLEAGDSLRFRLFGPTRFHAPGPCPARYALAVVQP